MSIFHAAQCGYCPSPYAEHLPQKCPKFCEIVSDADMRCWYFVHDALEAAHQQSLIYGLSAEDWPPFLFEGVREYRGDFIAHGDETYVDVAGALGVDEDACYGFGAGESDFAMRRAVAFFERYCCTPPLPADIAPVHMLPHEREYFRVTATVLKTVCDSKFWGIRAFADNDNADSYAFTQY